MKLTGLQVSEVLILSPCTSRTSRSFRTFHSLSFSGSSPCFLKRCSSFWIPKLGNGADKCRGRGLTVRAASEYSSGDLVPIAPLRFESPVGQLLAQILQTHPHLLPAAIDQQLGNLLTDKGIQRQDASSKDLLYKIAEVREKERRNTLEEIIYCLIVQKFIENDISMIPKITATAGPVGRVDFWPNQEQKLESVHSPEAFEMIQSHLSLVLGERTVGPLDTIVEISKIKLGKLYAASIMYGYFLRRVDQRFQLERTMNTFPEGFKENRARYENPSPENRLWEPDSLIRIEPDNDGNGDVVGFMDGSDSKSYRLRSYVMHLDAETLQRYATIRSKEAISLIEKQTRALLGRPNVRILEDGSIDTSNDEVVALTFSGLAMLVLEAVAFGSSLWDAETYVETKYPFVKG
ncbi:UV-B-induced protein At3g17800, chloroplastic-like isoform X2 [Mangifera indica]|uniref:UV-B-induced protein At3g17800, chloroplastic-like isoform X2 n=1 Tax=Mangifera indica TaxID=29780 RepID=UPI001CFB35FE|nr:UV-B-induced protein At3g17800, chloroplastic-like isoform X2 [Mangifera indica]